MWVGRIILTKRHGKHNKPRKYTKYINLGFLTIPKKTGGTGIEKLKKKMHEYGKTIGLKKEIENPLYIINFLDLILNTTNNTFHPYIIII